MVRISKKRRIENLIILLNRSSAPEIEMRTSFCQPIFELSGNRGKTNSYFMYDGWNRMGNTFVELFEKFRRGKRSLFSLGPFMPIELLSQKGWCFNQILQGGVPMALAALTKLNLGFESTVLPFDLNVEAEALGATVRYHEEQDGIPVYPTIAHKAVGDADDIVIPEDIDSIGRVPLIASAIAKTRAMADGRGAVGAFVAGPFTLAGQIMDLDKMLVMTMKQPEALCKILSRLSQTIIAVRDAYVRTGAQFIVVQDGGVAAISPKLFSRLVLPFLKDIFCETQVPHILSIAGNADRYIEQMLQCGADGLGVDQSCDLDKVRGKVPWDLPLAATIGSYTMLAQASPDQVAATVRFFLDKGLSIVLPPADICPPAKTENIVAFVEAVRSYPGPPIAWNGRP
jgi:[methyl-Co(III) methanol-specific corrinoid protein]:coenzyme M methyltransferase